MKTNPKTQLPSFARRTSATIDDDYMNWLQEVKNRLCRIQAKAAFQVNRAMLEFYWSMGHDLALRKELGKHGDGIVTNVSLDLRAAFPTMKGLSENNIWSMKRWFLFYNKDFLHHLVKKVKMQRQNFTSLVKFCRQREINSKSFCQMIHSSPFHGVIMWKSFSIAMQWKKAYSISIRQWKKAGVVRNWYIILLQDCI